MSSVFLIRADSKFHKGWVGCLAEQKSGALMKFRIKFYPAIQHGKTLKPRSNLKDEIQKGDKQHTVLK